MMGRDRRAPVVSTISRSNCNSPSSAGPADRSGQRRTPRTLQQTQPLLSSTTLTPGALQQGAVDIGGAKLVLENGHGGVAMVAQEVVEQGGLAGAEKTGQQVTATACVMLEILWMGIVSLAETEKTVQ